MAWTTPKTWTIGQLLSSSDMNAQVSSNVSWLATAPTLRVHMAGAWNSGAANQWNLVAFDTVDIDNMSGWSAANHWYVIPQAGIYFGQHTEAFNTSTNATFGYTGFQQNGNVHVQGMEQIWVTGSPPAPEPYTYDIFQCAVNDTIAGNTYSGTANMPMYDTPYSSMNLVKVSN